MNYTSEQSRAYVLQSVTDIFISPNVTIPALFHLFDQSFYGAFLSEIIHILDLRMNTK